MLRAACVRVRSCACGARSYGLGTRVARGGTGARLYAPLDARRPAVALSPPDVYQTSHRRKGASDSEAHIYTFIGSTLIDGFITFHEQALSTFSCEPHQ